MIIVLKANTPKEEAKQLIDHIKSKGLQVDISKGARQTVMGLVGNTDVIDVEQIQGYECVDKVMRVEVPYKRASRAFHPQDSVIPIGNGDVTIGGKKLAVIAGPCSIETPDQIEGVACDVAKAGANILRGGAFKPRTSPYSFQGLGNKGLDMLRDAGRKAKLPVITESCRPISCLSSSKMASILSRSGPGTCRTSTSSKPSARRTSRSSSSGA